MTFVPRNHEVKALSSKCPNTPFTDRIRHRRPHRREEGGPSLRLTTLAWSSHTVVWHVFPHGSGRDAQTELEQELVGDPLLPPRWVILSHLFDEESQLNRDARAAGCGFPPPKEAEALTVPACQRLRLHDAQ